MEMKTGLLTMVCCVVEERGDGGCDAVGDEDGVVV